MVLAAISRSISFFSASDIFYYSLSVDATLVFRYDRLELDGMDPAVAQCIFKCAVNELMLLDQRLPFESLRSHCEVEMIHRSGAIEDADLRIRKFGENETLEHLGFDHAFRRGEREFSASANPRASLNVSGSRVAPFASAAVTPLARTIPVTPTRIAGTPLARIGPISMAKVRCNRAIPRKNARRVLARLFIANRSTSQRARRPGTIMGANPKRDATHARRRVLSHRRDGAYARRRSDCASHRKVARSDERCDYYGCE